MGEGPSATKPLQKDWSKLIIDFDQAQNAISGAVLDAPVSYPTINVTDLSVLDLANQGAVTKGVNGTSNTYSIHLSPMSDWTTADEADALRRQRRAAAKLKWRHKDKVTKRDLGNIVMRGGCVTGVKDETNRERRLRLTRIMHITQV